MKRASYREPDHSFGQTMLTLRTAIGLTQTGLAGLVGVSRRAVGDGEAGSKYPSAAHLKRFIALAVEHQVFPPGREPQEVRALWQAAHQKVLLDEAWLNALLLQVEAPPALQQSQETNSSTRTLAPGTVGPKVDWDDAPAVPTFYGREWELSLLTEWVVQERCRVVSILGLGSIGKSALSVSLMHQAAENFEAVIWRSLRDLPSCEVLLNDLLRVLAPQLLVQLPASTEQRSAFCWNTCAAPVSCWC